MNPRAVAFQARSRYTARFAPVAQLDRVPGFEPGGREFESLRAYHPILPITTTLFITIYEGALSVDKANYLNELLQGLSGRVRDLRRYL